VTTLVTSDIGGVFDVTSTLGVETGRTLLAHCILRRIFTPAGGLFGVASYGWDVLNTIGSSLPAHIVEQRILRQVRQEQEVLDARCSVKFADGVLSIVLQIKDADGPFTLTIQASELTSAVYLNGELFAEAA
jgi:hypothetical protein